jgi:hypothetical protein
MLFIRKNPIIVFVLSWGFLTILSWLDDHINDQRLSMVIYLFIFGIFVYSSYLIINDFKFESSYFKHIFYVFILYELFIFAHGVVSNGVKFFSFVEFYWFIRGGYFKVWPLIIPLFVFFDKRISNFVILFDWTLILGIIALIIFPIFPSIFLTRALSVNLPGLTYGCGILLLFATYIKDRKVNISFIVIFITLLSFTYLARRNNIVTSLGFILFAYIVNFRSNFRPILFRIYPLLIGFGLIVALNFSSFTSNLTERLSSRITEDSRSDVLIPLFIGMKDYEVFGKGLNGTYYSPSGGELEDEGVAFAEVDDRDLIEVGYLQLYLNGGIVYIVLYTLIFLPAVFNGIFRSKNLFSKACGVIILLWMVDMFIYGIPILSFHYIFVWICIGVCYKSSFRNKTEDEIRLEFQKTVLT